MWDNNFGAWLYSFVSESWIVDSQEKIQFNVEISAI